MPPIDLVDPVASLFQQAEAEPARPAVVTADLSVNYAGFAEYVRHLAHAISQTGDHPKILINLGCGFQAYAAMFATLMAGGYYVPLNVDAPLSVRRRIFELFAPDAVIGAAVSTAELNEASHDITAIDPDEVPQQELTSARPPHELAYVIFTSGSTGSPKGVMVTRHGLENYLAWIREDMAVTPNDRWSQHPNIGFDLSVLDIFGALANGASLHPIGTNEGRLMAASAIKRRGLTIWNSVPSVVDLMIQSGQLTSDNLASLRLMTFCGEPLLEEHLAAIFRARPDLVVHNTYGPTEATVSCTLVKLNADNYRQHCDTSAALGNAIRGMRLDLVNGPNDDEGEIRITGPQVAGGYWNDDDATAKAFSAAVSEEKSFLTGDWARRTGGNLYFRSRIDTQIKIMGHRLELSEIDAAIRKSGIPAVACTFVDGKIHGFLQLKSTDIDLADLRQFLLAHLEPYAIPFNFHFVDELPRNTNDKIDQKALEKLVRMEAGV